MTNQDIGINSSTHWRFANITNISLITCFCAWDLPLTDARKDTRIMPSFRKIIVIFCHLFFLYCWVRRIMLHNMLLWNDRLQINDASPHIQQAHCFALFLGFNKYVLRKWFGSANCDTIYTLYLSLCTQTANPNHFRGTHCT